MPSINYARHNKFNEANFKFINPVINNNLIDKLNEE